MTTIQQLPEEVLCMIFDKLETYHLKHCQKVCRRWYTPTHIKLLQQVNLPIYIDQAAEKFIASIDYNPDPKYLNAVKSITIGDLDRSPIPVDITRIDLHKLFFRFPNIQEVHVRECLGLFTDSNIQVCKAYSQNCPKLKIFKVTSYTKRDTVEYCDLLYKLRDIVSVMPANNIDYASAGYGSFSLFVTSFPRLIEINDSARCFLNNFRNLLTVLEKLPRLEAITISKEAGEQDPAQQYLERLTNKEQDILVDRLSKLKRLDFRCGNGFSVDSINFAHKYLTGLESVYFLIYYTDDWMDSQNQVFCDIALDLLLSAKNGREVCSKPDDYDTPPICIGPIMYKIFADSTTKSVLTLHVEDHDSEFDDITIYKTKSEGRINVFENYLPSSFIKANAQLSLVDVFKLEFGQKYNYLDVIDVSTYSSILQGMTALKEVVLDVPSAFSDSLNQKTLDKCMNKLKV